MLPLEQYNIIYNNRPLIIDRRRTDPGQKLIPFANRWYCALICIFVIILSPDTRTAGAISDFNPAAVHPGPVVRNFSKPFF